MDCSVPTPPDRRGGRGTRIVSVLRERARCAPVHTECFLSVPGLVLSDGDNTGWAPASQTVSHESADMPTGGKQNCAAPGLLPCLEECS